ncbi:putative polyketide synthase [Biscogniauxia mediterranea]|nr:putative polyketide synthase [Biscogniauxia mediterranea]
MDPQQRKLLEIVFECFESAGVSLDQVSGSNTGVYVGNFTHDYLMMQTRDPDYLHRYHATGSGTALLANRISHVFNLHGPSVTLDTACSSSIYSLHVAVAALKAGECDSAIVAGVNLIMTPETQVMGRKAGVLSPTSTCHTFDTSADGYGRAEGVNAVYIKRLSSALRDGDEIYAVIRGTAVNSNGRTPGITLPSADLQEAVIRKAYQGACLDFSGTDYIECHGTGTAVGDPIEIEALGRCFHPRKYPVMIGSVKTNLGHSEAASGLTSLIKGVLSLQRGLIPPTRGINKLNPKLGLHNLNMKVVTDAEHWPRNLRRASLNAFGYGGANAHVCPLTFLRYRNSHEQLVLLPVSAASRLSLEVRTTQVAKAAESCDFSDLGRLAHTLIQRRSRLQERSYVLATNKSDGRCRVLDVQLPEQSEETHQAGLLPFAFIFTGQGSQYAGMAKELLCQDGVFRSTIRKLDEVLRSLPSEQAPDWTLEQAILEPPETSRINHVTQSQPVCTAIQIALVDLLRDWGVNPDAVVGHSSGEIAAAYTAGIHSASQAILIAYYRGLAADHVQTQGAMVVVRLSKENAETLLETMGLAGQVYIACVNSPESVTLSGPVDAIHSVFENLQVRSQFARLIDTGGRAYHSPLIQQAGQLYEKLITPYMNKNVEEKDLMCEMYSSAGSSEEELSIMDGSVDMPKYWRGNLEAPVQFSPAIMRLATRQKYHLIEIGPHSALKGSIYQIQAYMGRNCFRYTPSLIKDQDASLCMRKLAGNISLHGYELKWHQINNLPGCIRGLFQDLPPYPWDYSGRLLWAEPRISTELRNRVYQRHELLGSQQLITNDIDWHWYNLLNLDELPWLRDHKIENQVVFPAACYLAMAIEAISQIQELRSTSENRHLAFEFSNVSFNSALVLSDQNSPAPENVELHTTMSQRRLSTRSVSADSYDFNVSSWTAGQSTMHCVGSIRLVTPLSSPRKASTEDTVGYRHWPANIWYSIAREEGYVFGPHFKSLVDLYTDNYRIRPAIRCTTLIKPPVSKGSTMRYLVHPVTIDACLQTASMSAASGNLRMFRAYIPVDPTVEDESAVIQTRSQKTGFGTMRADCLMCDTNGKVVVDLKDVRFSLYTSMGSRSMKSEEMQASRHPVLRVNWKPDFTEYVVASLEERQYQGVDYGIPATIAVLVDLIGHKNPRMHVLQLGSGYSDKTEQWLEVLGRETPFPRCRLWHTGEVREDGGLDVEAQQYDVLIYLDSTSESQWKQFPNQLTSLVKERSIIITLRSEAAFMGLTAAGFVVIAVQEVFIAVNKPQNTLRGESVLIVTRNPSTEASKFIALLIGYLTKELGVGDAKTISIEELDTTTVAETPLCISLLEFEHEFLATMTQADMDLLRVITRNARDLLWLTGANMLGAPDPDLSLVNGLARSLVMEQPSLGFTVMDIGTLTPSAFKMQTTCDYIGRVLMSRKEMNDKEFIQSNDLLYIRRVGPDFEMNSLFRRRLKMEDPIQKSSLATVRQARLSIGQVGLTDTLYFQELCHPPTDPPAGFVDIAIRVISLNAKDVYGMNGFIETRHGTSALEFGGVVTAVGRGVTLKPGDRVVGAMPINFSTTERVPARALQKLLPHEDLTTMATIPVAYCTALYALRDCARIRAGESILIHSGAGAFGMAAIKVAQNIGAVVYTTVGSARKREFLTKELGLPATHIFHSRDDSFVDGLKIATGGRGVDVVINSLTGSLMHASWGCVANFGRFIEVGKRELLDNGKLDMHVFLRNVSFTAFDLSDFLLSDDPFHRDTCARLLEDAISMYRSGEISPAPITKFSAADVSKAYRYFSSSDRIGKIVISLDDYDHNVPVAPSRYRTIFDPLKVYLLVGCLGGLGRSLSGWMLSQGARRFVFLGRSGTEKKSAKDLVSRFENAGAQVQVIRGDVSCAQDVETAVEACTSDGGVLGGVVQAAMVLHEELFDGMHSDSWHTCVRQKWQGTWNLHHAIEGKDKALDFFLLTSSMTGSVGIATQSNYCAANAFLDAFACWRRNQGKVAVSVGLGMISEVGTLHENPRVEALLLRRGIHPLNEDEFLQVIDLALSDSHSLRSPTSSHLLTGMEPMKVLKLLDQGFEVTHTVMDDQPSSILASALEVMKDRKVKQISGPASTYAGRATAAPSWLRELPQDIAEVLMTDPDVTSLRASINKTIGQRFSNLILMPIDRVDYQKSFSQYGVDSMIASEFRTWFWNTFRVDIPFLDLLSSQKNLDTVAELLEAKLLETSQGSSKS